MANNFDSNLTKKIATSFGKSFQSQRVLTKAINTQLAQGQFNPSTGSTIYVRRPHEAKIFRTAAGDITGQTDDITSGQAPVTVMNLFTTFAAWDVVDEALKMDAMDEIMAPLSQRIVTELESDVASRMLLGGGLTVGTHGTAVSAWSHVAAANTMCEGMGIDTSGVYYVGTPGTKEKLADAQRALYTNDSMVKTAWENAQVSKDFGGLTFLSSNNLADYTSGAVADRAGTISGTPTVTYAGNKDTMTQSVTITALTASTTNGVRAGDMISVAGRYRINPHTKKYVLDSAGNRIPFTAVIQAAGNTGGSGEVTVTISGSCIYEAGKFDNCDSAITNGDVVTVLGSASTVYKPNLFFHKDAFALATIPLPRMHSTDAYITTKDGFSIRVSKYANGDANTNKVRFDLMAAFGVINPHMAGRAFGV